MSDEAETLPDHPLGEAVDVESGFVVDEDIGVTAARLADEVLYVIRVPAD